MLPEGIVILASHRLVSSTQTGVAEEEKWSAPHLP